MEEVGSPGKDTCATGSLRCLGGNVDMALFGKIPEEVEARSLAALYFVFTQFLSSLLFSLFLE